MVDFSNHIHFMFGVAVLESTAQDSGWSTSAEFYGFNCDLEASRMKQNRRERKT